MTRAFWILCIAFLGAQSVSCQQDDGTSDFGLPNDRLDAQTQESIPFSRANQFLRDAWNTAFSLFDCFGGDGTTTPPSNFSIALDLRGVSDSTEFEDALTKWRQVIVGDLPDHSGSLGGSSSCGAWPSSIDDVYICGVYKSIDGLGSILGSASPRHYRPTEGLPLTGEMSFDTVDVEAGRIQDLLGVILHEMGHVLGIGSLWQVNGLVPEYTVPCSYKFDSAASREYQALSGCSSAIPLEQNIVGSNCVHWAEGCFTNEVMTSAANSDLPVSRLTLAGMEDLGYKVDYSQAESYSTSDMNPSCLCNNRLRRNLWEDSTMQTYSFMEDEPHVSSSSSSRRKLSEEGRQSALDYGQGVLAENRDQISLFPESNVLDIGGDVVYVLYLEEDEVYSVLVTAEMV